MNAIHNLRLLGGSSDTKKSSTGAFSLKFDMHKVIAIMLVLHVALVEIYVLTEIFNFQKKRAARKDRTGEEETWQLSRFYPMIEVQ